MYIYIYIYFVSSNFSTSYFHFQKRERKRKRKRNTFSKNRGDEPHLKERERREKQGGGLCLRRYRYNVASRCSFPAAVPPIYRTLDPLSTFPFRARGETFPGKFQRPKAPAPVTSSAINRVDATRRYPPPCTLYIPSIYIPAHQPISFSPLYIPPSPLENQPSTPVDGWISPLLTRVYGHGWPVSHFRKVVGSSGE